MATSTKQRVGIIIIAVVMALGTIGSFIAMIFANSNAQHDATQQEQLSQEAQKAAADYQKRHEHIRAELDRLRPDENDPQEQHCHLWQQLLMISRTVEPCYRALHSQQA